MQEAISASADGLAFALVIANVTFYLFWCEREEAMGRKSRFLLGLLATLSLSVKPLCEAFALLFAFIPRKAFRLAEGQRNCRAKTRWASYCLKGCRAKGISRLAIIAF